MKGLLSKLTIGTSLLLFPLSSQISYSDEINENIPVCELHLPNIFEIFKKTTKKDKKNYTFFTRQKSAWELI